ncbi:nucleotide sugar dehydrogenase [soil metagenome]
MEPTKPTTRFDGKIAIIGLGYVGLPLAVAFAEAGIPIIGIDRDRDRVDALNLGGSHVEDVRAERVRRLSAEKLLHFTTDYSLVREAKATIICLPTPLDEHKEPDLSAVVAGSEAAAQYLAPGALVVLESTTYPGTTREVLLPIFEGHGRRVGKDFYLAFSPERIDPGNRLFTVSKTPRIVGGVTAECTSRAERLYSNITQQVYSVSAPESAELAKLLENTFRSVNIALANELAILCHRMGIDVWEVIEAAGTKPFGFMPFYPGPGLGGHCIPIDPFYLSWRARSFDMNTEFVELAGRVNVGMPDYAFNRITGALNSQKRAVNGSRVLMLGVSYKPNVSDLRESPSLKILGLLVEAGAEVAYHDPHVPHLPDRGLSSVKLTKEELVRADCVVIATNHDALDLHTVVKFATKIVDFRNAVRYELGKMPDNVEVL